MKISRTEQKRRIKEIEELVTGLAALPESLILQAPLSEDVQDLLLEVAGLQGGSRKRQIKYITKLLKTSALEELYAFYTQHRGTGLVEKKQEHELAFLRDTLLDEALELRKIYKEAGEDWAEDWPSQTVVAIEEKFPAVDTRNLIRLSYLFSQTRNPKYSREIFRYLCSVQEQEAFSS